MEAMAANRSRTVSIPGLSVSPLQMRQTVVNEYPDAAASAFCSALVSASSRSRQSEGMEDFIAAHSTDTQSKRQADSQSIAGYRASMSEKVRATLWENLQTLMLRKYGKENLYRLGDEAGTGSGTPGRLKLKKQSIGIDVLAKFADALGVEPWQLLADGLGETMSQSALTIARKFDALPDDRVRLRAYTLIDQALEQARQGESIQGPPPATTPTDEPAADERTRPATARGQSAPSSKPAKAPPTRAGR
jgi:hypothetical protein